MKGILKLFFWSLSYFAFLLIFYDLPITTALALNIQSFLKNKPISEKDTLNGEVSTVKQIEIGEILFEKRKRLSKSKIRTKRKSKTFFKLKPAHYRAITRGINFYKKKGLFGVEVKKGLRLYLELRPELQHELQEILRKTYYTSAAILVCSLKNNSILGMVSADSEFSSLEEPFFNNKFLFSAQHPSASLVKIVTAAAGIEHYDLNPWDSLKYFTRFHGSGKVRIRSFLEGFANSDNDLFGSLNEKIGPRLFRKYFKLLLTDLTFPHYLPVSRASISDDDEGNLFSNGSGLNSYIHISVFHALALSNIVANDGIYYPFNLVRMVEYNDRKYVRLITGLKAKRKLSRKTARRLETIMVGVVHNPMGTAYEDFSRFRKNFNITVCGKTGTITDHNRTHYVSWFTGYAPMEKPEYSLCILLKFRKGRISRAAKVASQVFSNLFTDKTDDRQLSSKTLEKRKRSLTRDFN
ncbi:penicillin-binding transpeptidase domain-containing protein [Candidatus Riflebacteria bacterium]